MESSDASELYRGRLEDFIRRRDALAKQLRAGGDRAAADRIKSLRKPSRTAWALNLAATGESLNRLVSAVDATVTAQSTGGDVRKANMSLREAVRAFASSAADAAATEGVSVEASTLATALLAVLSDPAGFDQLQHGALSEVPEAGGLDFLARLPAAPVLQLHRSASSPETDAIEITNEATRRTSARAAVERAQHHVAERRKRADEALRDLNRAESDLDTADRRLKEAHNAVIVATTKRDAARMKTEEASALMRDAEQQLADAQSSLED